ELVERIEKLSGIKTGSDIKREKIRKQKAKKQKRASQKHRTP
ncbi:MAG TPA: peptide chain release factor-like protein, partial [Nitrospiraceae bacterium]|nr:peptide chain release factor-like protein [Nitrospiraceae bacterium]